MAIVDELNELNAQALRDIEAAADTAALEEVRVAVLGKTGTLTGYLRGMGQLPKEERAEVGKTANDRAQWRSSRRSRIARKRLRRRSCLRRWMRKLWTSRFPAAASRLERAT